MVGDTSFELVTPSMSPKCSTTELIAPTIHQSARYIKRRIRATYIVNALMLQDLFAALFKQSQNFPQPAIQAAIIFSTSATRSFK